MSAVKMKLVCVRRVEVEGAWWNIPGLTFGPGPHAAVEVRRGVHEPARQHFTTIIEYLDLQEETP